jgi:hypothetical protein
MTDAFFHTQMARLIGLKFVPGDMTTHWEALQDLPEEVLIDAVSRAGRTRVDFPTPHELRQDADMGRTITLPEEEDRTVALDEPYTVYVPHSPAPLHIRREWTYYCTHCSDSGWRSSWCGEQTFKKPWQESELCGLYREHAAHEWVIHCLCYTSNPALVRKRSAQQQYAVTRTAKGKT